MVNASSRRWFWKGSWRTNSNFQIEDKGVKNEETLRERDSTLSKQTFAESCGMWQMLGVKGCQQRWNAQD